MIDLFIAAVRRLSLLCGIVAACMFAVSIAIVCQLVFMRYVLNESTIWQTELVTYLMLSATLIGMPYVQSLRGHVNVDLLPIYLRGTSRFALAVVSKLLALGVCLLLAVYGYDFWYEAWDWGEVSDTVWGVPLWRPYLSMPVGFGLMSLQLFADLLALVTGRDHPFGLEPGKETRAVH